MASNPSPILTLRVAALAAVLAVPSFGLAQFDDGSGRSGKPWGDKLNTKRRVQLSFRNSSIDAIIAYYQNVSGVTIVKDPGLTGTLTLSSAKPVSLDEAFSILNETLKLKGYQMELRNGLLVVRKQQDNRGGSNGINIGPIGGDTGGTDNQSSLRTYPINFANASQIARVINSVFADSGNSNFGGFGGRPFGDIGGTDVDLDPAIQGFGGGGQGGRGGQGGNRGGFGGQGGNQNGRGGFNFGRGGQTTTLVHADYDDYSNTVIVSAPERFQSQVNTLIRSLDKTTENPVSTKTYLLKYTSATTAASVVTSVLNANVPRGKGGATTGQTQGTNGFFSALRGQTAGAGTAVADSRTNALVVTATPDNIKIVDQVVKELDTNVPIESTTFVLPLNNARADDVATLIQNAFGTRTGLNGARTTTNNTNRNTTNTRATTTNTNNRNGQRTQLAGTDLELALQDPNAESGELATSVGVTQGFGQGFFGQNNNGNRTGTNTQQTQGFLPNGEVVNTRDLSNQVTVVADTNTNSLIIVTAPEYAEIVKRIVDQLDKIPQQVLIETVIVEASLTASDKLGVTFQSSNDGNTASSIGGVFNNVGSTVTTTNTSNEGFQYSITGKNYNIFLNALKQDSKFQVLATPKIFTSNGVQAEINISQSIPYITNSITDVNGNISYQYAFQDVGVVLTVTPRITSNGYVSMDVTQTANDLQGYTSFNAPIVNQRSAETTVSVKDNNTVILGGIIRKDLTTDVRKIPLLGDIPVLGQLFRSNVKSNVKTELLVFLTPRIVNSAEDADRLRRENEQKVSPETRRNINEFRDSGNNDAGQRNPDGTPKTNLPVPEDKKKPATPPTVLPTTTPPAKPGS